MEKRSFVVALVFTLIISFVGCGERELTVQNENISYELGELGTVTSFTGNLKGNKPFGVGSCIITTERDTLWMYNGELGNNALLGEGTVEHMPYTLSYGEDKYTGTYTGRVTDGQPNGKGYFNIENSNSLFDGTFKTGELMMDLSYNVTEMPLDITFQDKILDGKYTGQKCGSSPSKSGTFVFNSDDESFTYNGTWTDNQLKSGYLECNFYNIYFTEVTRTGTYSGEIVDGVACGNGEFSAVTSEGVAYTYTGEWLNGLFDGIGQQIYDEDSRYDRIGHFTAGEFTPDIKDILKSVGTGEPHFELSDFQLENAAKYAIELNDLEFSQYSDFYNFFMQYTDPTLTYTVYTKNPNTYEENDKLMYIENNTVVQIWEENDFLGYKEEPVTQMIIQSYDNNHICYVIFTGESEGLYEGSNIDIWGYPIAYTNYTSIDGTKIPCIYFVVSAIYLR